MGELPDSWASCQVGQIANVCLGGTPSRKIPAYWGGEISWVTSGEVANCRIKSTSERITTEGLNNSNSKIYPPGTVLIAMIGEGKTRGQSAILDIAACTNQNVAGLILDSKFTVPEYVWIWALSLYETHRSGGRGGNYPALNGSIVRQFNFPLAPLAEQHEIVRRVEALLARADRIEKQLAAATRRVETLTQAILAQAFCGELVPTEAELARQEGRDYEPASVLLERIRTERADLNEQVKGNRRKRPGGKSIQKE
jgi:type I restriction enzyme S subunit